MDESRWAPRDARRGRDGGGGGAALAGEALSPGRRAGKVPVRVNPGLSCSNVRVAFTSSPR